MAKRVVLGVLLLCAAGIGGCAYGGVATTADGTTVYIARNDMIFFGLARRVYTCKASGTKLDCHVMDGEP